MSRFDPSKVGLDTLLDLDGYTMEVGGGFWISMRAIEVPRDGGCPHGIRYALNLHSPGGERLMGYDNAHAPKVGSGPAAKSARPLAFDHIHRGEKVVPYKFQSPGDLLEDFWDDVDAVLNREGAS